MNNRELNKVVDELRLIAEKTVRDCTFSKNTQYLGAEATLNMLLPSGDEKYKSFWLIDTALVAQSGLVPSSELKKYVEIIASHGQNGEEPLCLENDLTVPPYAVADHINYDGGAVFFPGTYNSGKNQGNGAYGYYSPLGNCFYFIILVSAYVSQSQDYEILNNRYGGLSLFERLRLAFDAYSVDSDGLCVSDDKRHVVDWCYTDAVKKSGKLLAGSVLRYNSAMILADFSEKIGIPQLCSYYSAEAKRTKAGIVEEFYDKNTGWFYAATGIGRQYDVWGTAYAVYSGITEDRKTLEALYEGYRTRTAVSDGYVRQILTSNDFSESSAWESALSQINRYQNGGYWATPTGWYAYALYKYNSKTDILTDFIKHTKEYATKGAPFEWKDSGNTLFDGARYGTSGVMPYVGAKQIIKCENETI